MARLVTRRWGWATVLLAALSLWPLRHAGTALVIAQDIDQPDAIVSLASHEWERLPAAAALAAKRPSAKVLLTVPLNLNAFNCHDCANRVERLVQAGVAPDRIVLLPKRVYRTFDEAVAFREWAVANGVRRVMVVTSPYHTARALAAFRHATHGTGIVVGVSPAPSRVEPARWWRHKFDRWYVTYEWEARLFYFVRFGVH